MSISSFYELSRARPGETVRNFLTFDEDYFGFPLRVPYIHLRGSEEGVRGFIIAAVHGDELNGTGLIFEIAERLNPQEMKGELILLPIANVPAFFFQSRYLPDRRDLNRLFPGDGHGSEGSRLAYWLWENFLQDADFGLDLHAASYNRWNYPHVRGNMRSHKVRELARAFGAPITIHSQGVKGSLRREATKRGMPVILFEAGQANRLEDLGEVGISGILRVLTHYGLISSVKPSGESPKITYFKHSSWLRAPRGGLFFPKAKPGERVKEGDILGEIRSVLGEHLCYIRADKDGQILGYNLHPQVIPGRALYHICYDETELE
ncbi:MAG: succinylglutamate desuccinylase/aspartoacylase family protein [Leptospiraceae bacterium]|nr:succinylglutamate desuccinylase/aspartoacylase family protein [Leptospiraceae bacterium]MDW8307103.1 succinylglutamate desuccinylase/aspartoacylase family protein [Leptospiraceae bacterium]